MSKVAVVEPRPFRQTRVLVSIELKVAEQSILKLYSRRLCSSDLAFSRNTASFSTPETSLRTLPLEVPVLVRHRKDDQDSTQPTLGVESIKSLDDFSFSSSATCGAIRYNRHRIETSGEYRYRIRLFQRSLLAQEYRDTVSYLSPGHATFTQCLVDKSHLTDVVGLVIREIRHRTSHRRRTIR